MTTVAQKVRRAIREELGLGPRQVSVRNDHGHVAIRIKTLGVSIKSVEEVTHRFEERQYDHASGDVLRYGVNTFVNVDLDHKMVEQRAESIVPWLESIPVGSTEDWAYGDMPVMRKAEDQFYLMKERYSGFSWPAVGMANVLARFAVQAGV